MNTWLELVQRKAEILHGQIASLQQVAAAQGVDDVLRGMLITPYYDLLKNLYEEDYPRAKAADSSDLLLYLQGPAVEIAPRLSLISNIFNNVKQQVKDLTKALAGIDAAMRMSSESVDLGLSGLAKGSLYIGFTLPSPVDVRPGQQLPVLGENDPLFMATKQALRTLGVVSQHVTETDDVDESLHEMATYFPDPKIRDSALLAVRRLAPTTRSGISSVSVIGKDVVEPDSKINQLTPKTRKHLNKLLRKPIITSESDMFEGVIREIDLDAHRFELRRVRDGTVQDIRCIYDESLAHEARSWLDAKVQVTGLIERRDDTPRLLMMENLKIITRN